MNKKLLVIPAAMLALSVGFAGHASADNIGVGANLNVPGVQVKADAAITGRNPGGPMIRAGGDDGMHRDGVFGTVTAVNGSTITVQTKTWTKGTTTSTATTYTVNAGSATVMKANAASTLSAIAVGDNVMVQGTVSGTTVTATKIDDGVMMKGAPGSNGGVQLPQGNGQPVIGGKVTAVSGNTVTITNNSNATYTIDVTNAKITKAGTTSSVSNVAVGDEVLAQGTINGNAVTAVTLNDGVSANMANNGGAQAKVGFFGKIGGFFKHLFGF